MKQNEIKQTKKAKPALKHLEWKNKKGNKKIAIHENSENTMTRVRTMYISLYTLIKM